MEMTQAEIERYAPYHTFPEFERGYMEYPSRREMEGVAVAAPESRLLSVAPGWG